MGMVFHWKSQPNDEVIPASSLHVKIEEIHCEVRTTYYHFETVFFVSFYLKWSQRKVSCCLQNSMKCKIEKGYPCCVEWPVKINLFCNRQNGQEKWSAGEEIVKRPGAASLVEFTWTRCKEHITGSLHSRLYWLRSHWCTRKLESFTWAIALGNHKKVFLQFKIFQSSIFYEMVPKSMLSHHIHFSIIKNPSPQHRIILIIALKLDNYAKRIHEM